MDTELIACEFSLIRYMPDPVRNEFVNIGVLLREVGDSGKTIVRFTREWSRARCMDQNADVELLRALEDDFRLRLGEDDLGSAELRAKPFVELLSESLSQMLQITDFRPCMATSLEKHMDTLMQLLVEPKEVIVKGGTARRDLYSAMRKLFKDAKIWNRMRKGIPAAYYTKFGDPLKIDCGIEPAGVALMFHAVSLQGDLATAKALAFSMPALRDGVLRLEHVPLELTAVVESLEEAPEGLKDEQWRGQYAFAVETMKEWGIKVLTRRDLSKLTNDSLGILRPMNNF